MKFPADVTFHPSWWHKYAGVDFDEKFFFDLDYRLKADQDMRRVLFDHFGEYGLGEKDPKVRPILFSDLIACGFLYSQLLGCEVRFARDDAPTVLCAKLDEKQALSLACPNLDNSPLWLKVQRQVDEMMSRFGYVESAVNLMGVQNIALDLRGEELFYDYYDAPEAAENLLKVATMLSLDIGRRLQAVSSVLSGGVSAIIKQICPEVYLTSNCSVTMISLPLYREHLLPYDQELAHAFPNFGIHHCGSNTEVAIDGYLEVPQLKFLEIGAGSNLVRVAESIRKAGREDLISCIRYSPVKLKTASRQEIEAETQQTLSIFDGFANLCFSCVGIDSEVSIENVKNYLSVFA